MKGSRKIAAFTAVALTCGQATFAPATAGNTDYSNGQHGQSTSPLVLKAQGSMFIGQPIFHAGTSRKMYTQYMIPAGKQKLPIVLLHGGGLNGSAYETTPEGKMGWDEFWVRKGRPVYVPDLPGVGRSEEGYSIYYAWDLFRFGPKLGDRFRGVQWPFNLFPTTGGAPVPNPQQMALVELRDKIGPAIWLGHSATACTPVEMALLNPSKVKAIVSIEGCDMKPTPQQIAILKNIPILLVYGDYVPQAVSPVRYPGWSPQEYYEDGRKFIQSIQDAGGNATFLLLPDIGIRGNTHMMMIDKNNTQVAGVIEKWIEKNVGKGSNDDDHNHW